MSRRNIFGRPAQSQVDEHKTTLVFVNTRRMAEQIAGGLGGRLVPVLEPPMG